MFPASGLGRLCLNVIDTF